MTTNQRNHLEQNVLTSQELATMTGEKLATVKQRYQRGTIDGVKKGRDVLFMKSDFKKGEE